jgi:hypothetical protein
MSKQSAVEWLVEEIHKNGEEIHKNGNWIPIHMIEQAKQMEKGQIHDALYTGCEIATDNVKFKHIKKIEQYYNETYGGDHIGDVNEMVNHVPDVGKMVEDVEKLAEKYPYGGREGSKRLAFIDGYNTAKETLYTEEQVREAIDMATTSKHDYKLEFYSSDEIIQSLKQGGKQ